MTIQPTRGEMNHNPGNINFIHPPAIAWNGQVGLEIVPANKTYKPRFGLYDTDFNGIRASCKQLIKDNQAHGLKTIRSLVSDHVYGWAPDSDENDPVSYTKTVCKISGIDADEPLALCGTAGAKILIAMLPGFFTVENRRCIYARSLIASAAYDAVGVPMPTQGAAA